MAITTDMAITTELPALLWHGWGDEFMFSVHRKKAGKSLNRSNAPLPKADALARLREGWCFFGLCPRISSGQSKEHCSPEFDALWCEIDVRPGMSPEEALEVVVSRMEESQLGLYPSAITFSGNRSPHLFFKKVFWKGSLALLLGCPGSGAGWWCEAVEHHPYHRPLDHRFVRFG